MCAVLGHFVVMDVLDHRTDKDEYLVKWGGHDINGDPYKDTWEPESSLQEAPRLLRAFKTRLRKRQLNELGAPDPKHPKHTKHNG
jgi:hypothetical protein